MQRHVNLSGVGMTFSGWEYAEEQARVRAGTLTELGRLILWSPKKGKLEPSHFAVVPFKNLKHPPPDIEARTKLSLKARTTVRTLYYKPPAVREWKSAVFVWCEKGTWPTTDLIPTAFSFNTQSFLSLRLVLINNGLLFTIKQVSPRGRQRTHSSAWSTGTSTTWGTTSPRQRRTTR